MKVILTAAVSGLGKIGDVVEVKNGYARNFLIPNKKAICSTLNNRKIFELKKAEFEQANQSHVELATKVKNKIFGKDIIIIENASDDGRLYGSVNSSVIADAVNKIYGEKVVVRSEIFLAKPIKEIGIYKARLAAHSDVEFDLRLVVARSESEVDSVLKAEKEAAKKAAKEQADKNQAEKKAKAKKAELEEETEQKSEEVVSEAKEEKSE